MRFVEEKSACFLRRTLVLAGLTSFACVGRVQAFEADKYLSYNWEKFLVQPQLDLSTQFTDNLLYAPRGSEFHSKYDIPLESDFIQTFSPGVEVQYGRNDENSFKATAFFDELLYTNNSEYNGQQERLALESRMEFGRFTLKGTDSIQWMDQIQSGSSATFYRAPIRYLSWVDDYRLTYDATIKSDLYLGLSHNLMEYLQEVGYYNQGTVTGTLGATYKPSETLGVFVEAQGGHTSIDPAAPFMAPVTPSNIYGGFIGARGVFTPRIDGSVGVGYLIRDFPATVKTTDQSSPAVNLGLNYTQSVRRFFNLSYTRGLYVSSTIPDQSYLSDAVQLSMTQTIGRQGSSSRPSAASGRWLTRISAGMNFGNYGDRYTYIGDVPVNQAQQNQYLTGTASLVYQPNGWLTTTLSYQYMNYRVSFTDPLAGANYGANDYHVSWVTLQISIGY